MPAAIEIFDQGVAHLQEDELALALEAFTKAIALDQGLAVAYNGRAVVHALLGNIDRGIADCSEAIRLEPEDPKFYRTRGLIYREIGDGPNAEVDLARASQLGYGKP
jgi:Flp pilus assembly protein TadD